MAGPRDVKIFYYRKIACPEAARNAAAADRFRRARAGAGGVNKRQPLTPALSDKGEREKTHKKGRKTMLKGKTIVLGVCGGIAAYKAAELVRLYIKARAEVHAIMTASAREFIAPLTFQTLSGNPVHTEMFNLIQESEIGHISLADRADLFVVAPATANIIGKVAGGIADDLLTTTVMATKAPVLFVPAMNVNMYENPVYRRNEDLLKGLGYHFLEPVTGFLACGWEGKGKLPDPAAILEETERLLSPQDLAGETILVTAGPTREDLDPVRFLSNRSSGKMGYAIAGAASRRGARVILISGPTCLCPPAGVETVPVTTAQQMHAAVLAQLAPGDHRYQGRGGSRLSPR